MTTYFVSSVTGSDDNPGTSGNAALATLQAAANLVQPGDTVQVMNGTYTGPSWGTVLDVTTSGTASAPITFEAAPGQTPVIDSSGTWNGVLIEGSYIDFKGFTVVGDAAQIDQAYALAHYDIMDPVLDGNGITVRSADGVAVPNHVTIEGNTVFNEPGAGISVLGADYVQILNNVVHDNAHWSAYATSGIGVGAAVNSDTNPGTHVLISGNLSYNNTELVPEYRAGIITDGEGIILDTNPNFTGTFLVQGNTTYGNSGPGIESFLTDNAVITGNTTYGNLTNPDLAAHESEIFINQSNNNVVTGNSTTPTTPPAQVTLSPTPPDSATPTPPNTAPSVPPQASPASQEESPAVPQAPVTDVVATVSLFRFFDAQNGAHFYTDSTTEYDQLLATRSDLVPEPSGFGALAAASADTVSVYRFFDTVNGTHFFTTSPQERDQALATRSDLTYEPTGGFFEHGTQHAGDVPVYRLFSTSDGTHLYTGDASELTGLTTRGAATYRADLIFEGIAFYAPSNTST